MSIGSVRYRVMRNCASVKGGVNFSLAYLTHMRGSTFLGSTFFFLIMHLYKSLD